MSNEALSFPILVLPSGAPLAAQGTARQKVVVHLTHYTDSLHAVKMALHLAYLMRTMGADVTMLLDLEGVSPASNRESQELVWGKGDPIAKEYAAFVKAGASCCSARTVRSTRGFRQASCVRLLASVRRGSFRKRSSLPTRFSITEPCPSARFDLPW